jgi:hypothetical protein
MINKGDTLSVQRKVSLNLSTSTGDADAMSLIEQRRFL